MSKRGLVFVLVLGFVPNRDGIRQRIILSTHAPIDGFLITLFLVLVPTGLHIGLQLNLDTTSSI